MTQKCQGWDLDGPDDGDYTALSRRQKSAIRAAMAGRHVFVTGGAGCGKSRTAAALVAALRRRYGVERVAVTAATGLAATSLDQATSLHAFAGIGLGKGSREDLAVLVRGKGDARRRWMRARALVIDEISQIDAELLDALSFVARKVRPAKNKGAFGGLQIILVGDFGQLPPVRSEAGLAFEAEVWQELFGKEKGFVVNLDRCFRLQSVCEINHQINSDSQKQNKSQDRRNDTRYQKQLQHDDHHHQTDQRNLGKREKLQDQEAQANDIFLEHLNALRMGKLSIEGARWLKKTCPVRRAEDEPEPTQLCARNDQVNRINEERVDTLARDGAIVHDFVAHDSLQTPTIKKDIDCATRFPRYLRLAVGVPVILLTTLDMRRGLVNGTQGTVIRFERCNENGKTLDLPLVSFRTYSQQGRIERIIYPCKTEVPLHGCQGCVSVSREQLPLVPAFAMTIHKAQGLELYRVRVNLSGMFSCGQAYTALSRTKSVAGLEIENLNERSICAHPKVVKFYNNLLGISTRHMTHARETCNEAGDSSDENMNDDLKNGFKNKGRHDLYQSFSKIEEDNETSSERSVSTNYADDSALQEQCNLVFKTEIDTSNETSTLDFATSPSNTARRGILIETSHSHGIAVHGKCDGPYNINDARSSNSEKNSDYQLIKRSKSKKRISSTPGNESKQSNNHPRKLQWRRRPAGPDCSAASSCNTTMPAEIDLTDSPIPASPDDEWESTVISSTPNNGEENVVIPESPFP